MIENVLVDLPDFWTASYYRTSTQAEIDLVLEGPRQHVVSIEIKRTLTPQVSKGFRLGCEDIRATPRYYVIPAGGQCPLGHDTEVITLSDLIQRLGELTQTSRG